MSNTIRLETSGSTRDDSADGGVNSIPRASRAQQVAWLEEALELARAAGALGLKEE